MRFKHLLIVTVLACAETSAEKAAPSSSGEESSLNNGARGHAPEPTPNPALCAELDDEAVALGKLEPEVKAVLGSASAASPALFLRASGVEEAACVAAQLRGMGDPSAYSAQKSVFGAVASDKVVEVARMKAVVRVALKAPEMTAPIR